ncbi:MAG: hypothetical protein Q9210_005879 [Variospora velana]
MSDMASMNVGSIRLICVIYMWKSQLLSKMQVERSCLARILYRLVNRVLPAGSSWPLARRRLPREALEVWLRELLSWRQSKVVTLESSSKSQRHPETDEEAELDKGDATKQIAARGMASHPVQLLPSNESCFADIATDCSVIEFYTRFRVYMLEALKVVEGIGPDGERRIRMGVVKDGSGFGATVITLTFTQQA